MADKKISALTAASTPLAGTEVLPIVQSGATVKVAVSDLTAGRAISATQLTLTTGNLIVASGQGVDFSATPGTGTSELLADYEEGTFTPNQGTAITVVGAYSSSGSYTKTGRQVTITALQQGATSIAVNPSGTFFTNLPFTVDSTASRFSGTCVLQFTNVMGAVAAGGTTAVYSAGTFVATNATIVTTVTYFV